MSDTPPLEGLARTQYEGSGVFKVDAAPPPEPELLDEDMPTVDLPLIMPDDVSAPPPRRGPPPRPAPPPEPARVSMPLPLLDLEPARPRATDDDGAADAGALSQVEPVLTETMAELYLKQGHKTDALRVYHALLLQRPGDIQLAAKIAQLSGQGMPVPAPAAAAPPPRRRSGPGSGETVGSFLKGVLSGRRVTPPPAPAPREAPPAPPEPARPAPRAAPSPAIAESTLDSAFSGSSEAEAPAQQVGKPTRPADDSISLDSVFGDEGGRGSGAEAAAAPRPASASGGFSFDDFFGGNAPGAAPPAAPAGAPVAPGAHPDAKAAAPRASSGRNRPSGEDEGDLDQFQSWLKGLKG